MASMADMLPSDDSDPATAAGEALLAAVKSGNASKVGAALRSAISALSGDDEEEDDEEHGTKPPPALAIILGKKKG